MLEVQNTELSTQFSTNIWNSKQHITFRFKMSKKQNVSVQ